MTERIRVGRRTIEITNADKALFTDPKLTKLDLARHYQAVAAAMLPFVRDRPLALQVFPQGIDGHGFEVGVAIEAEESDGLFGMVHEDQRDGVRAGRPDRDG